MYSIYSGGFRFNLNSCTKQEIELKVSMILWSLDGLSLWKEGFTFSMTCRYFKCWMLCESCKFFWGRGNWLTPNCLKNLLLKLLKTVLFYVAPNWGLEDRMADEWDIFLGTFNVSSSLEEIQIYRGKNWFPFLLQRSLQKGRKFHKITLQNHTTRNTVRQLFLDFYPVRGTLNTYGMYTEWKQQKRV